MQSQEEQIAVAMELFDRELQERNYPIAVGLVNTFYIKDFYRRGDYLFFTFSMYSNLIAPFICIKLNGNEIEGLPTRETVVSALKLYRIVVRKRQLGESVLFHFPCMKEFLTGIIL